MQAGMGKTLELELKWGGVLVSLGGVQCYEVNGKERRLVLAPRNQFPSKGRWLPILATAWKAYQQHQVLVPALSTVRSGKDKEGLVR
jgi:hypothetical protein